MAGNKVELKYETSKENVCIVIDKYKFVLSNCLNNGKKRFRCANKKCSVSVLVDESVQTVLESNGKEHNHESVSQDQILKESIAARIKRKTVEDLVTPPCKIIRSEVMLEEDKENSDVTLPHSCVSDFRQAVYRVRNKAYPNLPETAKEAYEQLFNMQESIKNKGEQFCFVNKAKNMVIFTTRENLLLLQNSKDIFGDGTFLFAPDLFQQFYSIHVYKNRYYVPVAFCFLTSKDEGVYERMWRELLHLSEQLTGQPFIIDIFHADFELAAHNAVKKIFPSVLIKCCAFHLSQCWFKHIQGDKVLLRHYNDPSSTVGKWLKYFFGLPFLPHNEVLDGYIDLMHICPDRAIVKSFTDYVESNYLILPRFHPEIWVAPFTDGPRTTNGVESFHRTYNGQFYDAHPHVHKVVHTLRQIQTETNMKLHSIKKGKFQMIRKETRDREKELMDIWNQYTSDNPEIKISRLTYIQKMGYKFQGKKI